MPRRPLSASDDRLAQSIVEGRPKKTSAGRKYRCTTCGVMYPAEELTPDLDEDGRRTGWSCDSCI